MKLTINEGNASEIKFGAFFAYIPKDAEELSKVVASIDAGGREAEIENVLGSTDQNIMKKSAAELEKKMGSIQKALEAIEDAKKRDISIYMNEWKSLLKWLNRGHEKDVYFGLRDWKRNKVQEDLHKPACSSVR